MCIRDSNNAIGLPKVLVLSGLLNLYRYPPFRTTKRTLYTFPRHEHEQRSACFSRYPALTHSPATAGAVSAVCCLSAIAIQVSTGPPYSACLLYTSPSPRDRTRSRMPSSA
eukprot:TRINITY_DN28931_c0_g1_i2.p1 TRINITY_DN28931_c0_g1~~TRINITY_DN28931_c0_g1_i2.p1  ORF type:complete len:111 (-),score=25.16 TRINITY_DN28931_c0_g1_i2:95-427(-)